MVKPIDGPRPKPAAVPVETARAPAAGATQTPEGNEPPGTGFDAAKKRLVSITGRYQADKAPLPPYLLAYSKTSAAAASTATGAGAGKTPADVGGLLRDGTRLDVKDDPSGNYSKKEATRARDAFRKTRDAIDKGDYQGAHEAMEVLLRKDEDVVKSLPGEDPVKSSEAVREQLAFLAKLQAADVKADYPPTKEQLLEYFKTLKGSPKEARAAFAEYTTSFHVHPANVPGAAFDAKYSPDEEKSGVAPSTPDDWSEVLNRPLDKGATLKPESIGKTVNDCEGYAFMAQELLDAAGFKLEGHLTVHGDPSGDHAMAMFSHWKEPGVVTVTSNDRAFPGKNKKDVAREAFEYALPDSSGKETFHLAASMYESQVAAMKGKKPL